MANSLVFPRQSLYRSLAIEFLIVLMLFSAIEVCLGDPVIVDIQLNEQDVSVYGEDTDDNLTGYKAMATGDLNADSTDDLILGAPLADGVNNQKSGAGEVIVLFGPLMTGTNVDLLTSTPDHLVYGEDWDDYLGWFVISGDISGDGCDDLIMGAPEGDGAMNALAGSGEVHILFGPLAGGSEIDLSTTTADVIIYGAGLDFSTGICLAIGDLTGDGQDDLVVSATRTTDNNSGRRHIGAVHVFFGPLASGTVIDLSQTAANVTIFGDDQSDFIGHSLAVGDMTGDGIDDLAVSSNSGDGPNDLRSDAGEAYVFFSPLLSGTVIDLSQSAADVIVYGAESPDRLGNSISVSDVTDDGVDDLIMGATDANGLANRLSEAGDAYVLFGPFISGAVYDLETSMADVAIYGKEEDDSLGHETSAADVSGDGIADVLLCAKKANGPGNSRINGGEVYVFNGPLASGTIINLVIHDPDLTVYSRRSDQLQSLAPYLGDLSGDGTDDIIVGTQFGRGQNDDRPDSGEAHVIHGGNRPPIANAGGPYEADCPYDDIDIAVDGTGSYDPEGLPLNYLWTTDCPDSLFSAPTLPDPLLAIQGQSGPLTCKVMLTVTDDQGAEGHDEAEVSLREPPLPPDVGNRFYVILEAGLPRLSWADYPGDPAVTHYHVRRSEQKDVYVPAPLSQPVDKFWTDPSATNPIYFYHVRGAIDCGEMESLY
ncbi:hypothetical protein ACFLU6_09370 [Acidobacteriota bacterium]